MPKEFINCIANGGRVFTKVISKEHYVHGCELKGKTYWGEVKKIKKHK